MTDKELLELAAKAAGYEITDLLDDYRRPAICVDGEWRWLQHWNPLEDDSTALRLAVKLGLTVHVDYFSEDGDCTRILDASGGLMLRSMHFADGPEAATRRAIVRAAAEIGKMNSG